MLQAAVRSSSRICLSRRLALAVSISAARRSRRIGGTGPSRKLIGVVDVLGGRCSALRVVLDEGESLLEELGRFVAGHRQVAGGADSLPVVHLRGQVFWAPAVLLGDSWLRLSSAKAPILARPAPLEQDWRGDGRGISRRVCAGHRNVPVRPSLVKTICAERSCHTFVARGGVEGGALPCFADRIARPGCRCGGGRQRRPTRSRFSTRGAGRAGVGAYLETSKASRTVRETADVVVPMARPLAPTEFSPCPAALHTVECAAFQKMCPP